MAQNIYPNFTQILVGLHVIGL